MFVGDWEEPSGESRLKGDSQRRQLALGRDYADRHGLDLDEALGDISLTSQRGFPSNEIALKKDEKTSKEIN